MFFRRKTSEMKAEDEPTDLNVALIPVFRGKTKSKFGNQIVKIVQKSSFCSSSPVVKRIIVKNVEVICIVIETSGAQSVKVICASVPYMVNLLKRASPKFKTLLEDERVVHYITFFREIDFESLLSSVSSATIFIHKGVKKWYPIVCVQLGREAFLFGHSSLRYLLNLLLEGVSLAVHYICEDLPHVLQSLCAQNYKIAKYFVENLPVIALCGAKNFVLLTLFFQRLVSVVLKYFKRVGKLLRRFLGHISSEIDIAKISKEVYLQFKCLFTFIISGSTYRKIILICQQFLNWCIPLLKKAAPFLKKEILAFIQRITPLFKNFVQIVYRSVPKIYKYIEENIGSVIGLYNYGKHFLELILKNFKPYFYKSLDTLKIITENIIQSLYVILPIVKGILIRLYVVCRYFIVDSPNTKKGIQIALHQIRKLFTILQEAALNGSYILIAQCKKFLIYLKETLPHILLYIKTIRTDSLCLYQTALPIFQPAVSEISTTLYHSSKEVLSVSSLGIKRIVPSVWNGLKTVTPTTALATHEIVLAAKTSAALVYPELLKAIVVISPKVSEGLIVVLCDGGKACMEVSNASYSASQELFQTAKCVTNQLPEVYRAFSEVSITTRCAMVEVYTTSSKAKERVLSDLRSAAQVVNSAYNLAELELLITVNELQSDLSCIMLDHEEIKSVFILLNKTGNVVFSVTSKRCRMVLEDLSTVSSNTLAFSSSTIVGVYGNFKHVNAALLINTLHFISCSLERIITLKSLIAGLGKSSSVKDFTEWQSFSLKTIMHQILSEARDSARENLRKVCSGAFQTACFISPKLWQIYKNTNACVWWHFCNLSSDLWTFLELAASSTWELTCTYTPEIWEVFKISSFQTWERACEVSPAMWDMALQVIPVMWCSNRDAVQYMWEFHLKTCQRTWGVVIPLSSASWECVVKHMPNVWMAFCENSKSRWSAFCSVLDQSWNVVTDTSSFSWEMFQKTISRSWKHAMKPVTITTCNGAGSVIATGIEISYNACTKTKEIITVSKSWKHAIKPVTIIPISSATSAIAKGIKISYSVCTKTKDIIFLNSFPLIF